MELPSAEVIAALGVAIAGVIGAIAAFTYNIIKMRQAHIERLAKVRADQYLVDFDELEDLRWWRRLAIGVLNTFLDDYAEQRREPPVDVHAKLDYPPLDRPRKQGRRRLEP